MEFSMLLLTNLLFNIAEYLGVPATSLITGAIFTVVGFLLPRIYKYGRLIIRYVRSFFKPDNLLGAWYIFHNSIAGDEIVPMLQKMKIEKDIYSKYKLAILDVNSGKKLYTGSLCFEGFDYLLNFQSIDPERQKETFNIRLHRIFWDDTQPMHGLYVGVSFTHILYSTTCIVSKKKQAIDYYEDMSRRNYNVDVDKRIVYEERIIKNKSLSIKDASKDILKP